MWTPEALATICGTFLLAGFVKGVIGLGLPAVSLALLTAAFGLAPAMALMLVPSFVTNIWQGLVGGHLRPLLARLWSLLALAAATTWLGAKILAGTDATALAALLGLLLALYALSNLLRWSLPPPGHREGWASPLVGAVVGVLNGMTGSFVVPGVLYLQALGFSRAELIQAMGILFTVSTVALAVALADHRLVSPDLGKLSAIGVLPALAGMVAGQRLGRRLSEKHFRLVFFLSLLVLGLVILIRQTLKLSASW